MAVSRLGVMFFDDPAAAFANIRRAVRPGGQLAFLAWRGREHNPFQTAGERSASAVLPDSAPASTDRVGQFGFARAGRVRRILRDSGWEAVAIRAVDVPCRFPATDLSVYATRMGPYGLARDTLDGATQAKADNAVLAAFDSFVDGDMVRFNAACWTAVAHR